MLTQYRIPTRPMLDYSRQMGRFFQEFSPTGGPAWPFNSLFGSLPTSNIWENKAAYFVEISAPGVGSENCSLSLLGNELTVTIDRPGLDEIEKNGKYLRQERMSESSTLGITLPEGIDAQQISADLKNGVLLIRLPKTEAAQAKKIEVNTLSAE